MDREIIKTIRDYNMSQNERFISFGGDGTLLESIRFCETTDFQGEIIPVRDYGTCPDHDYSRILGQLLDGQPACGEITRLGFLEGTARLGKTESHKTGLAVSEIVLKNSDMTTALRFDVEVNGKSYLENVISDGLVISTPFGSHGYFKSVTRTLFYQGIGLAFIAPTYGICNLVVPDHSEISVKFRREASLTVSADKSVSVFDVEPGQEFVIGKVFGHDVKLRGYADFMCPKCRKLRNSTILNDQYFV